MWLPLAVRFPTIILLFAVVFAGCRSSKPPRPNILLITLDTLRADRVGCYGYTGGTTPNLDALAKDGVVFECAVAQVPLTWPSHAAILTGTHPFHNGVQDFTGQPLSEQFRTLAESLKANGYATGAVVSSFVLDRSWGLARGFDSYEDAFSGQDFLQKDVALVERRADQSVDHALAWLESHWNQPAWAGKPAQAGQPFFLWLHLYDSHSPYDPPEPYRSRFEKKPYEGEIAYADSQLGRLFEWLRRGPNNLYDRTMVVFLSDHGESLGEHGEKEHGFFVYDSTVPVPMVIKPPRDSKIAPRRVAPAAETIQLAPTVLELAGIEDAIQKQFQSASLVPLMTPSLRSVQAGKSTSAARAKPAPIADFTDIAERAGLTASNVFGGKQSSPYILESTGTGVAIFDYDNDGWPDIFLVNGTRLEDLPADAKPTNHLYHNNHDGTFSEVTQQAGLVATGWGQGACVGDYDNDGWEDLYVTYYGKNRLYQNLGGTFEEVAVKAGVAGDGKTWGSGCAFVDYDRDGQLDLAVANYADFDLAHAPPPGKYPSCLWKGIAVFCGPRGLPASKNILYRNLGNGRFQDMTVPAHVDRTMGHYCFSVSPFDFDNDGWPDIYVACDSAPSILYHNNRDGTFTDVGISSGVAYNIDGREQAGMGSAVADYDGDGNLDLFRTNFSDDTSTLYHNEGDGTFSDVTYSAGLGSNTQYLGWGTVFFDFDDDGWPDLLLANGHVYPEVDTLQLGIDYSEPKLLYHNNGNGAFTDISRVAGPGISTPAPARGLAVGDLWNDGRLSAVVVNRNRPPSLLVNRVTYGNHWIEIQTRGTRSNRSGIGARLILKTDSRKQVDEVRSGSSYISNNDRRVHFGLGAKGRIEYLEVHWLSGLVERFRNLAVDSIVTIKEGSGEAVVPARETPRKERLN